MSMLASGRGRWTLSQKAMKSEGLSLSPLTSVSMRLENVDLLPELTAFAHALFNSL